MIFWQQAWHLFDFFERSILFGTRILNGRSRKGSLIWDAVVPQVNKFIIHNIRCIYIYVHTYMNGLDWNVFYYIMLSKTSLQCDIMQCFLFIVYPTTWPLFLDCATWTPNVKKLVKCIENGSNRIVWRQQLRTLTETPMFYGQQNETLFPATIPIHDWGGRPNHKWFQKCRWWWPRCMGLSPKWLEVALW